MYLGDYAIDDAALHRAMANFARPAYELSAEERKDVLRMAYKYAEAATGPLELMPAHMRRDVQGPRHGYPEFEVVPLPPELQTRQRKLHDEMHAIMLNPHFDALWWQLKVDSLLRRNAEWVPFNVLCFLNHVWQRLQGQDKFMMMEQYTQSEELQANRLIWLYRNKREVHDELMHLLLHAIDEDGLDHPGACACPFHLHYLRTLLEEHSPGST